MLNKILLLLFSMSSILHAQNPKCDPNLVSTTHLRPACYLERVSDGKLSPTSLGQIQLSFDGEAAHMMYLHLTYQIEILGNNFQPFENIIVGDKIACRKNNSYYTCEMYYNPRAINFTNTRLSSTPFSTRLTGTTSSNNFQPVKIETTQIGAEFGFINFKIIGEGTLNLFDSIAARYGQTETIDCRPTQGLASDRYTTTNGMIYCLTNPAGTFDQIVPECRLQQDVTTGSFIQLPDDTPLQYGKKCPWTPHVIGNWNERGEEQIPEE